MATPSIFTITAYNNENMEVSLAFPWVASQWPMPSGSYFEADIRANIDDDQAIISFASTGSPRLGARDISVVYDATKNILMLGLLAPQSAISSLARDEKYPIDIRLTRPRGNADPRVDVIGKGFVTIKKGVTRD